MSEKPDEYFFEAPKRRRVTRRRAPARLSVGRRLRAAKVSRSSGDTAYCLRCHHTVKIVNPRKMKTKRGTPFLQGTCPHCRSKVARFQKRA